jgi:hypothetical protein
MVWDFYLWVGDRQFFECLYLSDSKGKIAGIAGIIVPCL